ncbi:Protein FAM164C [Papilio xuthus]|uniref:Protein FAM164C n=1 Tax=Papilio xuthus TaxID=66420 RepID=A0A0N0P9H8_PAPXU|nr:Protein FAM164C [Papilio xuthus]
MQSNERLFLVMPLRLTKVGDQFSIFSLVTCEAKLLGGTRNFCPLSDVAQPLLLSTTNTPFSRNFSHQDELNQIVSVVPEHLAEGTAAEPFIGKLRKGTQGSGKLSDLPPPPPSENPDYVSCPHCGRRFNQAAAERHIPKCVNYQFNKPKNNKKR